MQTSKFSEFILKIYLNFKKTWKPEVMMTGLRFHNPVWDQIQDGI